MAFAPLLFEIGAFLLGLLLGSFLNVCISRLPDHHSLSRPRSHCPNCQQTIRWYDNIPLLSWVLLRAKCRSCKRSIPWRYPLVELSTGMWFAFAGGRLVSLIDAAHSGDFGTPVKAWTENLPSLIALTVLGFLLIGLMVMDWQRHVLPDAFTLSGIAFGLLLVCTQAIFLSAGAEDIHFNPQSKMRMNSPGSFAARGDVFLTGPEHLVFGRFVAILAAAAIPLFIRWLYRVVRKREGMGLGDAKLLAMIAAFLGFWPAMLALFAGVLLCSGYAVVLLVRRRGDTASALPLGSFIAVGGLLATLLGQPLIGWYRSLL